MQSIVNDFKGQYSEVEIVKEMMREGELMLATCNVRCVLLFGMRANRNLFTSNLDMCECGIRNEETGKVKAGMARLANSVDVVSVLTQADDVCCNSITTINFALSEKLVLIGWMTRRRFGKSWSFTTVLLARSGPHLLIVICREDGSLETLIHYQLQAGHIDEELSDSFVCK